MNPRANLARVAEALGPLVHEVVFVGGATVDLFITDRASGPPRFTEDVDVIVRVATRTDYYGRVEASVRARGFKPDVRDDAPICRWVKADLTIDVMPTDQTILGFSNRWYEDGITYAVVVDLAEGIAIRVLSAPCSSRRSWRRSRGAAMATTLRARTSKTSCGSSTDALSWFVSSSAATGSFATICATSLFASSRTTISSTPCQRTCWAMPSRRRERSW